MKTPELAYQLAAIAFMAIAMAISFTYRLRAMRSREKIDSVKEEGSRIYLLRSLVGLALWVSSLLYLVNPRWMAWSSLPLPAWARWVGAVLMAICLPPLYWLFSSLGKNVTPTVAIRREHTLVQHGPYHWVRHPLYSVAGMMFLGLSLLAANWFIALCLLAGAPILAARTRVEEARLIDRFGDEYRRYMQTTGRYFPRLGKRGGSLAEDRRAA